jgi:IS1 family transposase
MNILSTDKKISVLSALVEGNSIRSIERMTGVHRDTVMRLMLKSGDAAQQIMDDRLRNLTVRRLQIDEIWTYVAKKQKRCSQSEKKQGLKGDQYVFVAIDAETKLIPSFLIGKRDYKSTLKFLTDVANRVDSHFQLSTDSFKMYNYAVPRALGGRVDYGQIHKDYGELAKMEKRYSPAYLVGVTIRSILGEPDETHISTSYIERQNLTMRMHMRRFTRLTNAFSKKLENLQAAVNLHFYHYNFMRSHKTLGRTPAMAAGVTEKFGNWAELLGL